MFRQTLPSNIPIQPSRSVAHVFSSLFSFNQQPVAGRACINLHSYSTVLARPISHQQSGKSNKFIQQHNTISTQILHNARRTKRSEMCFVRMRSLLFPVDFPMTIWHQCLYCLFIFCYKLFCAIVRCLCRCVCVVCFYLWLVKQSSPWFVVI